MSFITHYWNASIYFIRFDLFFCQSLDQLCPRCLSFTPYCHFCLHIFSWIKCHFLFSYHKLCAYLYSWYIFVLKCETCSTIPHDTNTGSFWYKWEAKNTNIDNIRLTKWYFLLYLTPWLIQISDIRIQCCFSRHTCRK